MIRLYLQQFTHKQACKLLDTSRSRILEQASFILIPDCFLNSALSLFSCTVAPPSLPKTRAILSCCFPPPGSQLLFCSLGLLPGLATPSVTLALVLRCLVCFAMGQLFGRALLGIMTATLLGSQSSDKQKKLNATATTALYWYTARILCSTSKPDQLPTTA